MKKSVIDEKTKRYRALLDQIVVEVKEATIDEHEEPFRSWLSKNQIITKDIERLRRDSNDRSKISAFLLETQYLEFKIIDLLHELGTLVNTDPEIVQYKGKKPNKELYRMTLGELYYEISKYEAEFLKDIKLLIKELNEKRIMFAHHLFTSIKGIDEVIEDAKNGLNHNNKVIEALYLSKEYIKKNTWYGQMYERKKVKEFSKIQDEE